MKTGNKRRKGFTLIELAIVVAILGALMTIILV
ncbi:type IV pilin protein, partial [Leptospira saintgironsiae]